VAQDIFEMPVEAVKAPLCEYLLRHWLCPVVFDNLPHPSAAAGGAGAAASSAAAAAAAAALAGGGSGSADAPPGGAEADDGADGGAAGALGGLRLSGESGGGLVETLTVASDETCAAATVSLFVIAQLFVAISCGPRRAARGRRLRR